MLIQLVGIKPAIKSSKKYPVTSHPKVASELALVPSSTHYPPVFYFSTPKGWGNFFLLFNNNKFIYFGFISFVVAISPLMIWKFYFNLNKRHVIISCQGPAFSCACNQYSNLETFVLKRNCRFLLLAHEKLSPAEWLPA